MASRWLAALVAAAALGGCFFDTAVPAAAQIACSKNSDCPSGRVCVAKIGRCVQPDALDETPPALVDGSAVASPPYLRAGDTFRLSFRVSEPLFEPPRVRGATLARAYQLAVAAADDGGWQATLLADPAAVDEGTLDIAVDLVDTAGNAATATVDDATVIDFTAPEAASTAAGPAVVRPGDVVSVRADFSPPDLALDGEPPLLQVSLADGSEQTVELSERAAASLAAQYAVPIGSPDGQLALAFVGVRDRAGNASAPIAVTQSIRIDATPPMLSLRLVNGIEAGGIRRYGQGSTVQLEADVGASEEPSQVVVSLSIGEQRATQPLADCPAVGAIRRCTLTAPADQLPSGYVLATAGVFDAAGNRADAVAQCIVDLDAPRLVSVRLAPVAPTQSLIGRPTAARPGGAVEIDLMLDEPASADRLVLTAGATSSSGSVQHVGLVSLYGTVAVPTAAPDGNATLTVDLVDEAGNVLADQLLGTIAVDGTPPPPIAADAFFLLRQPWSATPGSQLLQRSAVEAAVTLVVAASGSATTFSPIGLAQTDAAGLVPGNAIDLGSFDYPRAYVVVVDGAGNQSPAVGVAPSEWRVATAGIGGSAGGSTSPHRLSSSGRFERYRAQFEESIGGTALLSEDGDRVEVMAMGQTLHPRLSNVRDSFLEVEGEATSIDATWDPWTQRAYLLMQATISGASKVTLHSIDASGILDFQAAPFGQLGSSCPQVEVAFDERSALVFAFCGAAVASFDGATWTPVGASLGNQPGWITRMVAAAPHLGGLLVSDGQQIGLLQHDVTGASWSDLGALPAATLNICRRADDLFAAVTPNSIETLRIGAAVESVASRVAIGLPDSPSPRLAIACGQGGSLLAAGGGQNCVLQSGAIAWGCRAVLVAGVDLAAFAAAPESDPIMVRILPGIRFSRVASLDALEFEFRHVPYAIDITAVRLASVTGARGGLALFGVAANMLLDPNLGVYQPGVSLPDPASVYAGTAESGFAFHAGSNTVDACPWPDQFVPCASIALPSEVPVDLFARGVRADDEIIFAVDQDSGTVVEVALPEGATGLAAVRTIQPVTPTSVHVDGSAVWHAAADRLVLFGQSAVDAIDLSAPLPRWTSVSGSLPGSRLGLHYDPARQSIVGLDVVTHRWQRVDVVDDGVAPPSVTLMDEPAPLTVVPAFGATSADVDTATGDAVSVLPDPTNLPWGVRFERWQSPGSSRPALIFDVDLASAAAGATLPLEEVVVETVAVGEPLEAWLRLGEAWIRLEPRAAAGATQRFAADLPSLLRAIGRAARIRIALVARDPLGVREAAAAALHVDQLEVVFRMRGL